MKVLSLFDGISCGRVALDRAGIKVDKYVAYEIDRGAIKIAQSNYPDIEENGDVFKADFTQYKGFDLLIGGSPCTYWTIARAGHGRETTNSGVGWELFSQYVRAWKESGVPYFLYENNASMHKDVRAAITEAFGVEPLEINSSLVSAQSRRRLYWTNIPGAKAPEDRGISLQSILETGVADRPKSVCITRRYLASSLVPASMCRRYFGRSIGQVVFDSDPSELKARWDEVKKQGRRFVPSDLDGIKCVPRLLSVTECERLQTLPDGYTGKAGLGRGARIGAIGNGWTVDVIAELMGGLKDL